MFKKPQLLILTGLCFLAIYLIIQTLFQSSVLDVTAIENGIEVMAYCFVERQLLFTILSTCLLSFILGIFWGEYFTLKYPAKKE